MKSLDRWSLLDRSGPLRSYNAGLPGLHRHFCGETKNTAREFSQKCTLFDSVNSFPPPMAHRRKRVPAIDNEARVSKSADMVMSEWLSGWRIIPTGFCPSSYGGAMFLAVSRLENHQGDENTQNPLSDVIIYLKGILIIFTEFLGQRWKVAPFCSKISAFSPKKRDMVRCGCVSAFQITTARLVTPGIGGAKFLAKWP